jgi:hypothetical protein
VPHFPHTSGSRENPLIFYMMKWCCTIRHPITFGTTPAKTGDKTEAIRERQGLNREPLVSFGNTSHHPNKKESWTGSLLVRLAKSHLEKAHKKGAMSVCSRQLINDKYVL